MQGDLLGQFKQADSHKLPEIIWALGKSSAQISTAMRQAAASDRSILAVRVEPDVAAAVMRELPEVVYNMKARTLRCGPPAFCHQEYEAVGLRHCISSALARLEHMLLLLCPVA